MALGLFCFALGPPWPVQCLVFAAMGCGFYMLQPNQAAAITLFGSYRGTDRKTGLRWVLPWMIRKKLSVRANNFISEKIKVNDLRGNPIEMAAQIVWRVWNLLGAALLALGVLGMAYAWGALGLQSGTGSLLLGLGLLLASAGLWMLVPV